MTSLQRKEQIIRLAKQEAGHIVGGCENSIADGLESEMPTVESLTKATYYSMMDEPYLETRTGLVSIKKDLRFLGKEALLEIARDAVLYHLK